MPYPYDDKNPAMQSLNRFGGMIKRGVVDPAAKAMNYANPVTFAKNLWDKAGQLPQSAANFEKSYNANVIKSQQQQRGTMFGTPFNPTKNVPGNFQFPNQNGQKVPPLPSGNAQVLNGQNQGTFPPVDIVNNNYATGGAAPEVYNPEQVGGIRRASEIMRGNESNPQYGSGPQLPGQGMGGQTIDNDYMQQNYGENVYSPRTPEQRMAEGQESLARINRGTDAMIANRPQGGPTMAMFNQQPNTPDFSTGDSNFDKRHGREQRIAETGRMNAQTNANRLGNTAAIAAGNQAVNREQMASNEMIAGNKANALAGQNEYDRKKYQQGRIDKSNEFDSKLSNQIGQASKKPGFWQMRDRVMNASPELRQGYLDEFQKLYKVPFDVANDFVLKNTQKAGYDDMSAPILPPGQ